MLRTNRSYRSVSPGTLSFNLAKIANPIGPNAAKTIHHVDHSFDRITKKHASSHKIPTTTIDAIHAPILTVLSKW
jgi:hypothetical protein